MFGLSWPRIQKLCVMLLTGEVLQDGPWTCGPHTPAVRDEDERWSLLHWPTGDVQLFDDVFDAARAWHMRPRGD